MTYLIKDTSGTLVATVNNGVLNSNFDIDLIGQNYVHYGQVFNTDLYKIMENFANTTAPPKAVNGQLWYNRTDGNLYINKGTQANPNWQTVGGSGAGGGGSSNGYWTYDMANYRAGWNKFPTFGVDINANLRTMGSAYINVQDGGQTYPQNGLVIGTVDKATTSTGFSGVLSIWSNDSAVSMLQGSIALVTDPDPIMRRLSISAIEQGTAWANVTLAESGGRVGIATTNPTQTLDVYGNVAISGLARRVIADMDDATISNRLFFQTVNPDRFSVLGVIPNGTSDTSAFAAYNSGDPDNSSFMSIGSYNTSSNIDSSQNGTGQFLPIKIRTSNADRVYVGTDGKVGVNTDFPDLPVDINYYAMGIGTMDSVSGAGGSIVFRNDTSTKQWTAGILSNAGELNFTVYNQVNDSRILTITPSGLVGINQPQPITSLHVTTKSKTNDGIYLNSNTSNPHWLRLMPDMVAGAYNPFVQAGDTGIIYGHKKPCPDPGQGLVIAPWSLTQSGIRLDGCGNISIVGNFNGAGVVSGKWNFKDSNWSGLDENYNTLLEGGWEYTGAGENITFGIHATGGGKATLNVQGGIRQDYPGTFNWFQDYTGFGNTKPGYMIDVTAGSHDYPISIANGSDNLCGVLMTNSVAYQWEFGILGPSINANVTTLVDVPPNSFYVYDDNSAAARLVIDTDGKVGLNTQTPATSLHILDGDGEIRVEATPKPSIRLKAYTGIPRSTRISHYGTKSDSSFLIESYDSSDIFYSKLAEYHYTDESWNWYTNRNLRVQLVKDGGMICNNAIGGSMGNGTINAKGFFIDGVPVGGGGGGSVTLPYPVTTKETWNGAPQPNQSTYYWGATDAHRFALYSTAALRVAYATEAGHALTADTAKRADTAAVADLANALNPDNCYQVKCLGVGTASNGITGAILATNDITAFFSDERLKKDIELITDPLDKLLKLRGVTYKQNHIAEQYGYDDYSQKVGVIAQDVLAVLPEAVKPAPFDLAPDQTSKSGENYMTVQYEKLVPLLIEAVKELTAKVKDLESRLP